MESCPNCGSNQAHEGACPRSQAATGRTIPPLRDSHQLGAGQVLQNRYEILHMLGQGGMGEVYMGRDLRLKGRSCVVKKLRDDFYRDEDRQKAQEFFQREMEVLAELEPHKNIVRLLDYFPENGDFYLVMEYVQGNNLHFMLHEERGGEPFSEDTVIKWAQEICDVLNYLHEQHPPIIYRDLKPSNVMIDVKGEVKLVDFGIARRAQTGENTHVVSAGYSPPEQYWGSADARSDIYSLGATMHFLLTGRDPEALHSCSPRAINPDVSESLDKVIQHCTMQEVNERYQSAQELSEALLYVHREPEPQSAHGVFWQRVAGVVLVLAIGALFFLPQQIHNDGALTPGNSVNPSNSEKIDTSASRTTPTEPDVYTDARAPHPTSSAIDSPGDKTAQSAVENSEQTPGHADLAVQVTDEKDLTDPSGLSDAKGDRKESAEAPKKEPSFWGLFGSK